MARGRVKEEKEDAGREPRMRGREQGQGFLEGEQKLGFTGKRVLAESHAEGPRRGADLYISRLLHQVADRDKKCYPSPSENPSSPPSHSAPPQYAPPSWAFPDLTQGDGFVL